LSTVLSFVLGIFGGFFLIRGKKKQDVRMMLVGAVMIVLSYVMFS